MSREVAVEIRPSYDYTEWSKCERRFKEDVPLLPDQQQEYEALQAEYNAMIDTSDDTDPQVSSRLDEIEARMSELDDRATMWPPETLSIAGAVVSIGHKGEPDIHRGFVLPEDRPKKQAKSATAITTDPEGNVTTVETEPASTHSAALIESLTAHRSAAISAALLDRPDVALAAVMHAMARQVFFDVDSRDSSLKLSASAQSFRRVEGSQAFESLDKSRQSWGERLPADREDAFWQWCLAQDQSILLDLLAFCTASTIDAVRLKADHPGSQRIAHADALAASLKLDMAQWFTPTAENYFSRISKAAILQALQEAKGTPLLPATAKLSKTDLAAQAGRTVAGTGWLPAPLRKTA